MSVIFSFCKLTSVLRSGERDLYLGKILQWPVHVLLLHLGGGDGEVVEGGEDEKEEGVLVLLLHLGGGDGEDGEDGEVVEGGEDEKEEGVHVLLLSLGGEHGEDEDDVHLVGEDSEFVENMEEKDSRKGGDEAYE